MTFRYRVFFTRADPGGLADEVTTVRPLETVRGRVEAEDELAARGVRSPKIVGWALRQAAEQEK